jgi:hypothetical protein
MNVGRQHGAFARGISGIDQIPAIALLNSSAEI